LKKRHPESEFLSILFKTATIEPFSGNGDAALALAKKYGLAAGDALNLASAIRQGADNSSPANCPAKPCSACPESKSFPCTRFSGACAKRKDSRVTAA